MANEWQAATLVSAEMIAKNVKSLTFSLDKWQPHVPGQHYDIRLTAEDGYQAERSYSIASAPERTGVVELGIELLANGEVSPYLYGLQVGDQIEMRGPIGGSFIWDTSRPESLYLVGGGSGMVPLMAMLRHRQEHLNSAGDAHPTERDRKVVFLASVRDLDHLLYYDELRAISARDPNFTLVLTFTKIAPPGWDGFRRRVDEEMLRTVFPLDTHAAVYICGPTSFVESVANNMIDAGFIYPQIKAERFGGAG